jgi:hypothetical protein
MRMNEWLDAGFDPPFGTVEEWITDQLGRLNAEEGAMYALNDRVEGREGIRILVATDIGLFDFFWYRPEAVGERRLTGRHIPWDAVEGLTLTGETRLNEATLMHQEPAWRLSLTKPAVGIENPPNEAVLLDFWKQCREGVETAARR